MSCSSTATSYYLGKNANFFSWPVKALEQSQSYLSQLSPRLCIPSHGACNASLASFCLSYLSCKQSTHLQLSYGTSTNAFSCRQRRVFFASPQSVLLWHCQVPCKTDSAWSHWHDEMSAVVPFLCSTRPLPLFAQSLRVFAWPRACCVRIPCESPNNSSSSISALNQDTVDIWTCQACLEYNF